ncbi:hypothetical protein WDW89_10880 [Deltaproteobacteria bacterium TL4]
MKPHLLFTASMAGTANYLCPVLQKLTLPFSLLAQEDAARVFKKANLAHTLLPTCSWSQLDELGEISLPPEVSHVISGVSYGSTIDKALLRSAKKKSIPTVGIVENWSSFEEKFAYLEGGNIIQAKAFVPDSVWVNDEHAKQGIMKMGIVDSLIQIVGQPFLEWQYQNFLNLPHYAPTNTIVFVSEQIRDDFVAGTASDKGFDEYKTLEFLIQAIDFKKYKLRIKLHPEENEDKFDYLKARGLDIESIKFCDISQLLLESHKITGMCSMLLMEAALVRDDVLSMMPGAQAEAFVGNVIHATEFAPTREALSRSLTRVKASIGESSFGKRFKESTNQVLERIQSLGTHTNIS